MSSHLSIETADVIICGGGPAGSTCALALADTGLQVLVIDKSRFPRQKICGDAIAAYVPKVLNTIHPKYRAALDEFTEKYAVSTCRIAAPNGKYVDITSPDEGYISARYSWDNFLYELAAAEKNIRYFLDQNIRDVRLHGEEALVSTDTHLFKAKIVIGCDGAHSLVAKKLSGKKTNLAHHIGAVRAYYKGVSGLTERTHELHFLKNTLPGYFWIFPLRDGIVNVGLGILSSEISKRKINLRETLEDILQNEPSIRERFKDAEILGKIEGFGLPLGSEKVKVSGDRFMLCGDAASLIDPATGEGIGQAMISGRYAAWQIKRCFTRNNFSAKFMKQYDKQLYDKLWKVHRRRYFFRRFFLSDARVLNLFINTVTGSRILHRLVLKFIS